MKSKRKGSRREYQSRDLYERAGYKCTKAGGSLGTWDLVCVGANDGVLVQVKSNRSPGPAERAAIAAFPVPFNIRKEVHVWVDGMSTPEIRTYVTGGWVVVPATRTKRSSKRSKRAGEGIVERVENG